MNKSNPFINPFQYVHLSILIGSRKNAIEKLIPILHAKNRDVDVWLSASSSRGGRGASVARARVIPAAARHHTPVPAPLASSAAAQTSRQVPKTSEQVPPTQCQFVLKWPATFLTRKLKIWPHLSLTICSNTDLFKFTIDGLEDSTYLVGAGGCAKEFCSRLFEQQQY